MQSQSRNAEMKGGGAPEQIAAETGGVAVDFPRRFTYPHIQLRNYWRRIT